MLGSWEVQVDFAWVLAPLVKIVASGRLTTMPPDVVALTKQDALRGI